MGHTYMYLAWEHDMWYVGLRLWRGNSPLRNGDVTYLCVFCITGTFGWLFGFYD